MAARSHIEWTESTWNPVTGCTKTSAGCQHCYAERMAKRLQAMGNPKYERGFEVNLHHAALPLPLGWRKPHSVFVNSMGDLFHDQVPLSFIQQVFAVMKQAYWHRFQLLTKRARRSAELAPLLEWTPNIWMGVTVESNDYVGRIDLLRGIQAPTKFLSMEPLLGPVPDLRLEGIDWVIVGGESGPGARPVEVAWVTEIRDECLANGVSFFFKQWGGANRKKMGRSLEGRLWSEVPEYRGIAQPTLPF